MTSDHELPRWRTSGLGLCLLVLAASGCANHRPAECFSGYQAEVERNCLKSKIPPSAYSVREQAHRAGSGFVGLALSGGGSKSAPFALGVLAGLSETGVLDHIDAISTVSGGSYAALYLYSRLYAAYEGAADVLTTRSEVLVDCLPQRYVRVFNSSGVPNWSPSHPFGACPSANVEESLGAYWPILPRDYGTDPLRQASHLRGYQDVLSTDFSYANNVDSPSERRHVWTGVAGLFLLNTMVLGLPNLAANSLFDWRLDMSPSKEDYDAGIIRTYARDATLLRTEGQAKPHRPPGREESPARLTFPALLQLYEAGRSTSCSSAQHAAGLCPVPYWVINATAGTSRTNLRLFDTRPYTAAVNDFEFTPDGYGAGAYGWDSWNDREMEPRLTVPEAVGISAAFLDSQQRQVGGPFRPTVNLLLHASNLDWGSDIPNYRQTRAQYIRRLFVHNALPWPLYLFHHAGGNPQSLRIHLSDGGQSENLGVYALLRRGVKDIIAVDGGWDPDYSLGDWCTLDQQLSDSGASLTLDVGRGSDGQPRWSRDKCGRGVDPFGLKDHSPTMILRGWVCEGTSPCGDSTAIARLYIIKALLNPTARPAGGSTLTEDVTSAKHNALDFGHCATAQKGYPCEVITYRATYPETQYPQDGTTTVTLNSNAYIYGAYRALGRYYARHLQYTNTSGSVKLSVQGDWVTPFADDSKP